jgi:hypothetical protein
MVTLVQARAFALALPDATLQDHHGIDSYRVRGKVFATVPDEEHVRVMLAEDEIRAAVAEYPDSCAPFYWGSRLACVVVVLEFVEEGLLRELLFASWARKAPKALVQGFSED